jgi:hypothetical protein
MVESICNNITIAFIFWFSRSFLFNFSLTSFFKNLISHWWKSIETINCDHIWRVSSQYRKLIVIIATNTKSNNLDSLVVDLIRVILIRCTSHRGLITLHKNNNSFIFFTSTSVFKHFCWKVKCCSSVTLCTLTSVFHF